MTPVLEESGGSFPCESEPNSSRDPEHGSQHQGSIQRSVSVPQEVGQKAKYCCKSLQSVTHCSCLPKPRPDGGWAWVVMVTSCLSILVVDGVTFSFGVLYPELLEHFGSDRAQTSLIGSLLNGMYMCAGPFASALSQSQGYRPVAITGSVLAAGAFLAASFSPNVQVMTVTYGFTAGVGFCFQFLTSMVCATLYFDKWRPLAVGIASCGSGVGMIVFPILMRKLLDLLTWQSYVRVQAGVVFFSVLFGLMYRPLQADTDPESQATTPKKSSSFVSGLKGALDPSLFRSAIFCVLLAMAFVSTLGISVPIIFLTDMAMSRGVDPDPAAFLISILGISNTIGRVLSGLMLWYWPRLHPLLVLAVGTVVGGATAIPAPAVYTTYPLLAAFAAVHGLVYALDASLSTMILARTLGPNRLSGAFGLICLCRGIAGSVAGPIAGALVDVTGSYDSSYYMAGSAVMLTGLLSAVAWVLAKRREKIFDLQEITSNKDLILVSHRVFVPN